MSTKHDAFTQTRIWPKNVATLRKYKATLEAPMSLTTLVNVAVEQHYKNKTKPTKERTKI